MRKILSISFMLFMILSRVCQADAVGDINKVIADFAGAIEEKDKNKFLALFVDEHVSWVGVFSDKEFAKFRGKEGMPGKIYKSSPQDFIDWVVNLEDKPKEEFDNLTVKTDGEVAAVYFDYKFYLGEAVHNWGSESWLLVNTETGWKIQAVNFSYTTDK